MSGNVVEKVVNNELDMTAGLISGVKNFAVTKGVDIFQAIIIFSIGYMICCSLRGVVRRLLARSNVEPSAISFISEIIFFLCLAGVIIMALSAAGVAPATLAAAFGGIGLAIGLGLKDNIGNVASGIFILIFRPFRVGDYIKVGDSEGSVVDIRVMYTEISTLGNQMIVIPNSRLTDSVIKNYSFFETRNIEFTFDVAYDTDLAKCVELLQKLFSADAYVLNGAELPIYVSSMGESSIRIYVRAQVERSKYNEAQNHLYIKVKNAFDEAGIEIPFPQLVVHHARD